MLQSRLTGYIYEEEAVDIIKYMYNNDDSDLLLQKLRVHYVS